MSSLRSQWRRSFLSPLPRSGAFLLTSNNPAILGRSKSLQVLVVGARSSLSFTTARTATPTRQSSTPSLVVPSFCPQLYCRPSLRPAIALKTARGPFARRSLGTMAESKNFRLLCLENPLLDISAVGDQALLDKYGLKANDAILADPEKHTGLYDDLLTNYDAKLLAGGAAQNTARGAQYMLRDNSVAYVGGVGDDRYAAILRDAVRAAGLRVEYRVDPKLPTGRCGVVVTGHNRSMCTDLGAANCYDLEHLRSADVWPLVERADVFYVGGYHFTVCPAAIMALAHEAAARDRPFVLSLSAPFICSVFKAPLDASAPYWDYVVGNETEAAAWAEAHGLGAGAGVQETARALADLPKENARRKRVAIVTQGTGPTVVAVQGETGTTEYPVHAIDEALINDTTGAGDAFAAGLLAGIVEGRPLAESIDMGQWLARLSIQELGPSYPFPKQSYQPISPK